MQLILRETRLTVALEPNTHRPKLTLTMADSLTQYLSVSESLVGLLKASAETERALRSYSGAELDDMPSRLALGRMYHDLVLTGTALCKLQRYLADLSTIKAQMTSLVPVAHVVAILASGVLLYSELEPPGPWDMDALPLETLVTGRQGTSDLIEVRRPVDKLAKFQNNVMMLLALLQWYIKSPAYSICPFLLSCNQREYGLILNYET